MKINNKKLLYFISLIIIVIICVFLALRFNIGAAKELVFYKNDLLGISLLIPAKVQAGCDQRWMAPVVEFDSTQGIMNIHAPIQGLANDHGCGENPYPTITELTSGNHWLSDMYNPWTFKIVEHVETIGDVNKELAVIEGVGCKVAEQIDLSKQVGTTDLTVKVIGDKPLDEIGENDCFPTSRLYIKYSPKNKRLFFISRGQEDIFRRQNTNNETTGDLANLYYDDVMFKSIVIE